MRLISTSLFGSVIPVIICVAWLVSVGTPVMVGANGAMVSTHNPLLITHNSAFPALSVTLISML